MRKNYLLVALFAILSLSVGAREKQDGWKQLGTGTFCIVKDDNNIVMTDSVGNEPEGETARFYVLKKRK